MTAPASSIPLRAALYLRVSTARQAELRLKRLYDAIEAGVADIDDPALKDRIGGLKAIRDQAKADAERA